MIFLSVKCQSDPDYGKVSDHSGTELDFNSSQLREIILYLSDSDDYVMESFPIVKRREIKRTAVLNESGEVVQQGTYITKDTILTIYDEMQQAIETGIPYQTRLDPPPGPPTDAEGNFIPMSEWDEADWPEHIHPPRETAKISRTIDDGDAR